MYEIYMELVPANNGNKLFCINMAFRPETIGLIL